MNKILTTFGTIMFISIAIILTLVGIRMPFTNIEKAIYFVFMFLFFINSLTLFAIYVVDKEELFYSTVLK